MAKAITGAAAGVLVALVFTLLLASGLTRSTNAGSGFPANQLHCNTMGPGKLIDVHAGHAKPAIAIQSVKLCRWDYPSEWSAASGHTTYWSNPPAVVKLASGTVTTLPGDDEVVFFQNGAKIGATAS